MKTNKTVGVSIYSVSFHTKSPKGVQTFWFTARNSAIRFANSLRDNPKAVDFSVYEMTADLAEEYDRHVKAAPINLVLRWERVQGRNWRPQKPESESNGTLGIDTSGIGAPGINTLATNTPGTDTPDSDTPPEHSAAKAEDKTDTDIAADADAAERTVMTT